jgi:hypothetical protein
MILVLSGSFTGLHFFQFNGSVSAASTWSQDTGKNFKNGTLNNLSVYGSGVDAELRINLTGYHTWTKIPGVSRPYSGYYHEACTIWGDDKVLLFGGWGYYNTTWVFDLSNKYWSVRNPTHSPPARYWHGMGSIWGDDKVVMFGGQGAGGYLQDTWVYDSSDNKWTNQNPSGDKPYYYYTHSMATIWGTKSLLLYGGMYGNETWIYDYPNNTWTKRSPPKTPDARYYHSISSIHGTDKVLLYGGQYGNVLLDDTWIYDYSENSWVKRNPTGNPGTRSYPAMFPVYGTDQVVLYGGWWYNYEDIWIYDYSDDKWSIKKPTNPAETPVAGWYHTMAPVWGTDQAVLFGGYYTYYMDDTWIYRHISKIRNGSFVSAAYDTGDLAKLKTLSWNAKIPKNTSLRFQIRTAANESLLEKEHFLGPDGQKTTYYTNSNTEIWEGHNINQWIQCRVYFNINHFIETLSLDEILVKYNCLPHIEVLGPPDEILMGTDRPIFSWTFKDFDSDVQDGFQVQIDDDIYFDSINFDSGEQSSTNNNWHFPSGTNYTHIPDGVWYWRSRTRDDDGMWTDFSEPWSFSIDTKPPDSAIIAPFNDAFYHSLDTISGIAIDPLNISGVSKVELTLQRLRDNSYWDGNQWVRFVTWLRAKGTDEWTYSTKYVDWNSGKHYRIQPRSIDNVGNIEQPKTETGFYIDRDQPISLIKSPKNNVWLNDLDKVTGISMDLNGSGVSGVEVNIKCSQDLNFWDEILEDDLCWNGNDWSSFEYWLSANETSSWTLDTHSVKFTSGNHYLIRSRATDITKNTEEPGPGITIKYDDQPPEELAIIINDNDKYTTTNEVTLTLSAKDIASGLSEMSFSTDGNKWSEWIPFSLSYKFELPDDNDGKKTIFYKARDYANNIAEAVSDSIILDSTPPEDLIILINGDAMYTRANVVNLSLYAFDQTSGLSKMTFSLDKVKWLPWEPYSSIKIFSVPLGSGEKTVYFKVMDNANNTALEVFDSIIFDSNAPYSSSIFINMGALETNSTIVDLYLSAYDDFAGIDKISFSFDGESWTNWEPFITEKLFILPAGDGEKTVHFRVKDKAGNIAKPVSAKITLNTAVPETESDKPSPKESAFLEFWHILIIIIAALLISFIALTSYFSKRLRRLEEQILLPGSVTVKPGALGASLASAGALGGTATSAQLTAGAGVATPVPILAKSADGTTVAAGAAAGEVQPTVQRPQLPPAQVQEEGEETEPKTEPETEPENASTPEPRVEATAEPAPTPTPTPQPAQTEPKPDTKPATAQTPEPTEPTPSPKPAKPGTLPEE